MSTHPMRHGRRYSRAAPETGSIQGKRPSLRASGMLSLVRRPCSRDCGQEVSRLQTRWRPGAPKRAIGEDKLPNAMSVPAHVSQPGCVVLTRAQLGQIHPFPHPGRTNRRVCAPASAPAILRLDLAEGHATSSIPKPKCEMNTMRVINMTYRLQGRHGSARNAKNAFLKKPNRKTGSQKKKNYRHQQIILVHSLAIR